MSDQKQNTEYTRVPSVEELDALWRDHNHGQRQITLLSTPENAERLRAEVREAMKG